MILSIEYVESYIYGTRFDVITDHNSSRWSLNIQESTGRLARWKKFLRASDYNYIDRRDILHSNVDTVIRPFDNKDAVKYKPFENMPLIRLVKFGRYISDVAIKQI